VNLHARHAVADHEEHILGLTVKRFDLGNSRSGR
jgi:hypothetical protein